MAELKKNAVCLLHFSSGLGNLLRNQAGFGVHWRKNLLKVALNGRVRAIYLSEKPCWVVKMVRLKTWREIGLDE